MFQLSIRKKIILIPIIGVLGFLINFAYAAIINLHNTERLGLIHTESFPLVETLYRIKLNHLSIKHLLGDSVTRNNLSQIIEADKLANENSKILLDIASHHSALNKIASDTNQYFRIYYNSARNRAVSSINNIPTSSALFIQIQDEEQHYEKEFTRLDTKIRGQFLNILQATRGENEAFLKVSLAILAALVISLMMFSHVIASTIGKTFKEIINITEAIAHGEMGTKIPQSKDRETAQVLTAIGQMREKIRTSKDQIQFRERVSSTLNGNNYSNTYDNVLKLLQLTCELSTCAIYSYRSGEGLRCIHYRVDSQTPVSLELVNSINYAETVFKANHIVTASIISPIGDERVPSIIGDDDGHQKILFTGWPITFEDSTIGVFGTTHVTELSKTALSLLQYAISRMGIFLHSNQLEEDRTKLINHLKENAKAMAEKNVEMSKISQAKSDFLSNMSHELRTPLNVIIGFSRRLLRKRDEFPEQYIQPLEAIYNNGENLSQIVNNLLKLSSMQVGSLEMHSQIVSLDDIIDGIQKQMEVQADKSNLILLTMNDVPGISIHCDPEKLCDILVNILSNAIKFSTDGTITFHIFQEKSFLCFSVKDQGKGMSPEDKNALFDSFQNMDGRFTGKVGLSGSGLGLAIAKKYIDLHDGMIECQSELGEGSEFVVKLPLIPLEKGAA